MERKLDIVDYWLSESSKTLFDYRILLSSIKNPYFDTKHSIISRKFNFSKINRCQGRIQGGSDGGGRSPLGKFDGPQGYQNNDFHLKIRAVFIFMSSEKCHITIFARPPPTAMKFYYRRVTADLLPSCHKIQITNISLIRN